MIFDPKDQQISQVKIRGKNLSSNGVKVVCLFEPRDDNKYMTQETQTFSSQGTLVHVEERHSSMTTTYRR